MHATMTGLIENAFIPVHIFKHQFYPGFKWKPEYNKNQVDKKNEEKRKKMLQRAESNSEIKNS